MFTSGRCHPFFAVDRISNHTTTAAHTTAMICITTYPAGVARNSFTGFDRRSTDLRHSSSNRRSLHPCSSTSHSSNLRRSIRKRGPHQQRWRERAYRSRKETPRARWMKVSSDEVRASSCFRVNRGPHNYLRRGWIGGARPSSVPKCHVRVRADDVRAWVTA